MNIPVNPRTNRPTGYAFVTVSTSDDADRAISQLSNKEMLERKISIQRAIAAEINVPDSGNPAAEQRVSATSKKLVEDYQGKGNIQAEEDPEESSALYKVPTAKSPMGKYLFFRSVFLSLTIGWLRDTFWPKNPQYSFEPSSY